MINLKQTYRLVLLSLAAMAFSSRQVKAQSGFVSAGIEITGASGSLSASAGQTFDIEISGPAATISEGLQQMYPGTFRWQLPFTGPVPSNNDKHPASGDWMTISSRMFLSCHKSDEEAYL